MEPKNDGLEDYFSFKYRMGMFGVRVSFQGCRLYTCSQSKHLQPHECLHLQNE